MSKTTPARRDNLEFLEKAYADFQEDPAGLEPSWRHFFEGMEFGSTRGGVSGGGGERELVARFRRYGHLAARIDPLAEEPPPFPPELASALQESPAPEMAEDVERLKNLYCGTIGIEFGDELDADTSIWLAEQIEGDRPRFSREKRLRILERLASAEGFERFLHTRFLGKKRFSLEGLDALIPMLDALSTLAGRRTMTEIVLGMAHRGRLNVLANLLNKPLERMMGEFEEAGYTTWDIEGDVKYHMGFVSELTTPAGDVLRLVLSPNPSHLEAVCPVVEGYAHARQRSLGDDAGQRILPVLLHGDASFVGQGVVAETLNLAGLENYRTGGTVHIVTNNQIGFTTAPVESRSGRYASELARLVRAPVFHVNADDPEAAVWVTELALEYRMRFGRDVVVDLVGYRRFGHNEGDEPAFTQPLMYRKIVTHPSVFALYGARLVADKELDSAAVAALSEAVRTRMDEAYEAVRAGRAEAKAPYHPPLRAEVMAPVQTAVERPVLETTLHALTTAPENVHPHPKLKRILEQRSRMLDDDGQVDWAVGELLAFGTLALEGHPVRLSGQDCKRGTFSSRHAVLVDAEDGKEYPFLRHLGSGAASVNVVNSPLSEAACMGFEYGFSVANPNALVLWEAQFGDFANGAQVIIDQFLAASEAKWGQTCGLVLLLPHGYEGQGPEHSNARPERFLQLCGNLNMQVCNVTTPAQLFHVLRRQLKREFRKPLVLMTPKSLLRHPEVVSKTSEFTEGCFSEILVDELPADPSLVERLLCCSGKIYYDLLAEKRSEKATRIPILRFEQLHPFPREAFCELVSRFPDLKEVVWVQEEPKNMGAWSYWRTTVEDALQPDFRLLYAGRKAAGTTAEGYSKAHQSEQQRILREAFGIASGWESLRSFVK